MNFKNYFRPMEEGHTYHVYNQGNNHEKIFMDDEDRQRFKRKMEHYLSPFVVFIAFALMDNHFHIAIRIKSWEEMLPSISKYRGLKQFVKQFDHVVGRYIGWSIASAVVSELFRRLIMGYVKYYNKKYNRSGSLFRKGFRRKEVKDALYLKTLIAYIHTNPQHHGYKINYKDYRWSTFSPDYESQLDAIINKVTIEEIFESVEEYLFYHKRMLIPEDVME